MAKTKPKLEGEIGIVEVKNPHGLIVPDIRIGRGEIKYHEDRVTVARALRNDVLARLDDRGHVSKVQFRAGREWQRLFEIAEKGRIKPQDTTQEPVDGSHPIREPVTDKQMQAGKQLKDLDKALGKAGAVLVRDIMGDCLSFRETWLRHGLDPTIRDLKYLGWRFRECLDTLAKEFGYA